MVDAYVVLAGILISALVAPAVLAMLSHWLSLRKNRADVSSTHSQIIQVQGKSLADAFDEIQELRDELKDEREAREALEKELRRWRNYSFRLQKQIIDDFKGIPVPFDTEPPSKV